MRILYAIPANDDLIRVEHDFGGHWLAEDACGYTVRVSDAIYAAVEQDMGIDADEPCSDEVRTRFVEALVEAASDESLAEAIDETNASLSRWIIS